MLRRAAPLVRSLRSAATAAHSSSTASSRQNGVRTRGERKPERITGKNQGNEFKKEFKPRYSDPVETIQLMKKHQDTIESAQLVSLNDAIGRVNWYSSVPGPTLNKISEIMSKACIEELNSITDRSMASLFSAFGEMCREKNREEKRKLLLSTVEGMSEKGYSLGPLTRASIFGAHVDMAASVEELPSVVDELTAWEKDELPLNDDMVVQAARVYAMQGDRKGVIELTSYSRELLGRVDGRFVEWLAFSMIACGEGNGIGTIEKLSRSAPDSAARLWLSGALAAAWKEDTAMAVECLSRVPLSLMLQHSDNNGPVVDILVTLIERGVEGAEQSLSSYLALSDDGFSLHERHGSNSVVLFKARRAVNEGKIDAATRLYRLCHESQRNKKVGGEIRAAIGGMASKGESSVEEVRKYAMRLQESAIIESANSYLLAALRGDKLCELITDLRRTAGLSEAVEMRSENKFILAKELITWPSSTPLSVTPSVAALLYSTPLTFEERDRAEKYLFRATNKDPELVVRVLEELAGSDMADCEFLAGQVVNAALSIILKEKDVLSSGRIEKIIASKNIPVIRLTRMINPLVDVFTHNKDDESREKAVDLVSRIVIASFKARAREEIKSLGIIKFIGHSGINDKAMTKIVEKIQGNPSVGIGPSDMKNAIEEFTKRGLTKRVELLGMLKKKSQAAQRWHASSFEDLERELNALEGKKEVKEVVLVMMKTILLDKLRDEKVSTAKVVSILERFIPSLDSKNGSSNEENEPKDAWEAGRSTALRNKTAEMYTKTMRECAMEGDWISAEKLWKARGSLRSLPISSSLALSYHQWREGEEELSRGIVAAIRSNGQSVTAFDIYDLGEIFNNLTPSELEGVAEWLKKELRLEENVVDRIKEASVKRTIQEQIISGRLDKAFEVMKDSQKAIGHVQVMQAAIREENTAMTMNTFNLVASLHSKPTAMLDLAFAFLLEDDRKNAEALFKNPTLKLSFGKISFFIKTANEQKRIDVIHSLFSILVACPLSDEKISVSDLNYIAITALKAYEQANDMDAAIDFVKEIEGSTLIVDKRLKEKMNRVKDSTKYSSLSSSPS